MHFFSENGFLHGSLTTHYRRQKEFDETHNVLDPERVLLDPGEEIVMYNLAEVIHMKFSTGNLAMSYSYSSDALPAYAKKLKNDFKEGIITSYLDSPAHSRVPEDQRPPLLLSINADSIESGQNKVHLTSMPILTFWLQESN